MIAVGQHTAKFAASRRSGADAKLSKGAPTVPRQQRSPHVPATRAQAVRCAGVRSAGQVAGGQPAQERRVVKAAAAAAEVVPEKPAEPPMVPIKLVPLAMSVAAGVAIYMLPTPAALTQQAWTLLATFVATIVGVVLGPLPVGAWSVCSATFLLLTKTLTFPQTFSAFTLDVMWLIVTIFFIARAFVKTGLGNRCGFMFARVFGKTTLGLAYGLMLTEAIIAPGLPSTAARHGGVMLPVILALSEGCGSRPDDGTARKLGAYLVQVMIHCCGITSAMFLTGAAQNMLCVNLAVEGGAGMATFGSWLQASILPGLVSLLLTPYILYKLYPPTLQDTPDAPKLAAKRLEEMGPPSKAEKVVMATMLSLVALWIGGPSFGIAPTVTALMGLCALISTGVITWADCLAERNAWDTLVWFAILVGVSAQLNAFGVIAWISQSVSGAMAAMHLPWGAAFGVLHLAYFGVHYVFASQTAHAGALYAAFLSMMIASGCPAFISALTLSFNTNLFGAITHYASAQGAVYFGAGYVEMADWWKLGFIMAIVTYGVWGIVGVPWWKFLGLM